MSATLLALVDVVSQTGDWLAYHGFPGSDTTGFPGPGTWLIFAVILMPVWVMIGAWFVGRPNDSKTGLLGVTYLIGITAQMWIGMLVLTLLIGLVFFGGLPNLS